MADQKNEMSWVKAITFSLDMAQGINVLHTWDPPLFHRDLKSLNLLVTEEWRVKVCDFGLGTDIRFSPFLFPVLLTLFV
jgi:serine/threonine protein kinase